MTGWTITYGEHTWTNESITGGEAIDIAITAGGGWDALDPYSHPAALLSIVAVLCATRLDEPLEEALVRLRALPAAELMGFLVGTSDSG